jgi:hypothetical protein
VIFYAAKFPWVVRCWVDVCPTASKWRDNRVLHGVNFLFRRCGKALVYRPRVKGGGKGQFLIRISVWH